MKQIRLLGQVTHTTSRYADNPTQTDLENMGQIYFQELEDIHFSLCLCQGVVLKVQDNVRYSKYRIMSGF